MKSQCEATSNMLISSAWKSQIHEIICWIKADKSIRIKRGKNKSQNYSVSCSIVNSNCSIRWVRGSKDNFLHNKALIKIFQLLLPMFQVWEIFWSFIVNCDDKFTEFISFPHPYFPEIFQIIRSKMSSKFRIIRNRLLLSPRTSVASLDKAAPAFSLSHFTRFHILQLLPALPTISRNSCFRSECHNCALFRPLDSHLRHFCPPSITFS